MSSAIDRIKAKIELNELHKDIQATNRRTAILANRYSQSDKFGATRLPLSNRVPIKFAQTSKLLPHTQIESQDLMTHNPYDLRPEIKSEIKLMKCVDDVIIVPVFRSDTATKLDMGNLFTMYLVPFFGSATAPTKDGIRYTVSLFASLDFNLTNDMINETLKKKGYHVQLELHNDITMYLKAMTERIGYCAFNEEYHKIADIMTDNPAIFAAAAVCLQTFGKYVMPESLQTWYANRFRSIGRVMHVQNVENMAVKYPKLDGTQSMYHIMSTSFELRKLFVLRMFAFSDTNTVLAPMFQHVMAMLAGTDITHVYSIDTYIMRFMPEIMNLPILRTNENYLINMYEFWIEHKDIFPYVRLLIPPEKCGPINRNHLIQLTAAAIAVGEKVSDTYKNYKGVPHKSSMYNQVHEAVDKYFAERFHVSQVGLIASERSTMTHEEHIEMMARQEERIQDLGDGNVVRELETLNVQGKKTSN